MTWMPSLFFSHFSQGQEKLVCLLWEAIPTVFAHILFSHKSLQHRCLILMSWQRPHWSLLVPLIFLAWCSAPRNNSAEIQHKSLTKKCHLWLTNQSHWFSSGDLEEVGSRDARRREQKWGLKYSSSCFLHYQLRKVVKANPDHSRSHWCCRKTAPLGISR